MQKIPTELATPGMRLAKSVLRENGMTIMAEGMELTQPLIDRLLAMDVDRIVVRGNPVDLGEGPGGADDRLGRMDHLFRGFADDPYMMKVKAFVSRHFRMAAAAREAAQKAAEQAAANKAPQAVAAASPKAGEGAKTSGRDAAGFVGEGK